MKVLNKKKRRALAMNGMCMALLLFMGGLLAYGFSAPEMENAARMAWTVFAVLSVVVLWMNDCAVRLVDARREVRHAVQDAQTQKEEKERLTLENDALKQAVRQAEQANEAKTRFLSTVSHDVRTPLHAIVGLAELIDRPENDPAEMRQYAAQINQVGRHLLGVIDNVLDLRKIENGEALSRRERTGLTEFMRTETTIETGEKPLEGIRILMAEDSEISADIIAEQLKSCGAECVCAADGREAVKRYEENGKFDIILMDVQMPFMNGLEAAKVIREKSADKAYIPIVAMTANTWSDIWQNIREAGMDAYISKPIERDALVGIILNTLQKQNGMLPDISRTE